MKVLEFLKNCIFCHCDHKRSNLIKAFTLAEILIVLTVIGIMTAILLPAIRHTSPKEKIIKFQKAHTTFENAIRELVTSDKYYLDGDLSIKADGVDILGGRSYRGAPVTTDENLIKYFCQSLADVLKVKSLNCSTVSAAQMEWGEVAISPDGTHSNGNWPALLEDAKSYFDTYCMYMASKVGAEMTLQNGVVIYQTDPTITFGILNTSAYSTIYKNFKQRYAGFLFHYKPVCIDIDGIPSGANGGDCVNECPFGYGVRIDGKIVIGKRAEEWLKKISTNGRIRKITKLLISCTFAELLLSVVV